MQFEMIYFLILTDLQINLYLEQPMEIQLFATFFQRRKESDILTK
jgi:hypothetical protein